jgi:hypothetical protein
VISPCPKPSKRLRKPRSTCPTCRKAFTARALLRHAKGCGRPGRFGSVAKPVVSIGGAFPSRLEAEAYQYVFLQVAAGLYTDLKRYPSVELTKARLRYKPDFSATYVPTGKLHFFEAKGAKSERYVIIEKLWPHYREEPLYVAERKGGRLVWREVKANG